PSRLSSSATSLASLIGSLRGASASGYFELPMTRANRSPAANDGAAATADKRPIRRKEMPIFIRRRSKRKGRRSRSRLNNITLRDQHYQTAVSTRQPLAK